MSANNMCFAKEIDGKWYGWKITAEQSVVDEGWRELSKSNAKVADTIGDLEDMLGYSEYGLTTRPYLAKDGYPIKVVE